MKRFLCICLSLLCLAGCENQDQSKRGEPVQQNENTQQDQQQTAPPETAAPAQEPAPTQTEQKKTPQPEQTPQSNVVGSAKTKLYDHDADRTKNLKLAASAITNKVLQPGEVFSFNKTVGVRTKEKGYRNAKVFVDGETKEEEGGGICQVSTTIYQAAQNGGFTVVERHGHTKDVPYAKQGQDAAVSYGELDMQFKNNKDYPVILAVGVDQSYVYATIKRK